MPDITDPDGATPLTPDERDGLIPTFIATRDELNAAEEASIAVAVLRLSRRRRPLPQLLDEMFVRRLHREMLGDVWTWAGRYRLTERNIGVAPHLITVNVHDLMADAEYWLARGSWLTPDAAICKIHHRLVFIHPFPNGSGRHARAYADLIVRRCARSMLTRRTSIVSSRSPDPDYAARSGPFRGTLILSGGRAG